LALKMI